MRFLNTSDWPDFKMTPDRTLAWRTIDDQVLYVRPIDNVMYNMTVGYEHKPDNKSSAIGHMFRIKEEGSTSYFPTAKYFVLFYGNDPFRVETFLDSQSHRECLPFNIVDVADVYETDTIARLRVPFNRASKGYIPIVWNFGDIDETLPMHKEYNSVSIASLEVKYPPVDLDTQSDQRYVVLDITNGNRREIFGYNRNHLAYNGRLEDVSQDYPLCWPLYRNGLNSDPMASSQLTEISSFNLKVQKELFELNAPIRNPAFKGKANGLLSAAGLAGAASKGE